MNVMVMNGEQNLDTLEKSGTSFWLRIVEVRGQLGEFVAVGAKHASDYSVETLREYIEDIELRTNVNVATLVHNIIRNIKRRLRKLQCEMSIDEEWAIYEEHAPWDRLKAALRFWLPFVLPDYELQMAMRTRDARDLNVQRPHYG